MLAQIHAIFDHFLTWRPDMQDYDRDPLRRQLDEELLPFRLALKRTITGRSWLKRIRQAIGMPVDEMARRLGVSRYEIHRLEKSEKSSRIMLSTLNRAAKGLGCELVYALRPIKGTLEDLEAEQKIVREELRLGRENAQAMWGTLTQDTATLCPDYMTASAPP